MTMAEEKFLAFKGLKQYDPSMGWASVHNFAEPPAPSSPSEVQANEDNFATEPSQAHDQSAPVSHESPGHQEIGRAHV